MNHNAAAGTPRLFLASKSPRRRELLSQIGVPFELVNVDVEEQIAPGEPPERYVARLAEEKALAGLRALMADGCVLGADTVVVLGERILEKPRDFDHARSMLTDLSGTTHQVMTGIALAKGKELAQCVVTTEVTFRTIAPQEIPRYWQTREPCDKAGAYGIQGLGAVFISGIVGSYSNVVGLPLYETSLLLQRYGVPVWQETPGE